jgi:hypothetical protein
MPQGGLQASYTHCLNGHEFTPENTHRTVGRDGHVRRACRRCRRIRQKNAYDAMMAAARLRGAW